MDGDDDMHLCLVCHTTIMGLLDYVHHKKNDCPGRKNDESQLRRRSVQDLPPNQISSESSRKNTENTSSLHFSSNVTVVSEPQLVNDFNLTSTSSQFLSPQPKASSPLKPLFQSSLTQSSISSSSDYNMRFPHLSTSAQVNPRIRQNLYQEQSASRSADRDGNSFSSVTLSDSFNDTQDFSDRGVVGLVQNDLLQRADFSSNVNVTTTSISVDIPSTFSSLVSDISPASNGTVNPNDVISTESKLVPNPSENVDNFFLSLELRSKSSVETNQQVHKQSQRKEHAFILPDDCGERLAEDLPISNILSHLTFSSDEEDIDLNFADNVPLDDGSTDDSNDGFNLPTFHTGGKWKPGMGPGSKIFSSNVCSGKWKPGETPEPKKRGRPPKRGRSRGKSMHGTKRETVTGNKMYLCNFCNVSFYNRFQYSHHCGSKTHRENVFGKEEMQSREAKVHLDDEHVLDQEQEDTSNSEKKLDEQEGPTIEENNPEKFDSKECPQAMSKDEQGPVHICTICNKKYNNKYVMSRHLITKFHNNRSKGRPEAITLMQKYYKYIVRLSPFQCEICCFYFNQEIYFKNHMESEAHMKYCKDLYGEMVCSLCSFKTHSHDELLAHLKSQEHEALVAKRNKLCIIKESHIKVGCRYCGMVMYSYTRLKRHILRRHKDRKKTEPVKRVKGGFRPLCSVCNRQMSSQHALTIHMRRHKREKPYFCLPCNKGFTDKGALQMHEKTGKHTHAVVQQGQLSVKDVKNDQTNTNLIKTEESIKSGCFKVDEMMEDLSGNIEAGECSDDVSDGNDPSFEPKIVSKSVVSSKKHKLQRIKSNRRVKCDHCDFTVSFYNDLRPHYLEVHSSKVKLCEVCDLVFLSDKAMNLHNHSKAHQENISKLSGNAADTNFFTCKVCKKRFSDNNYCRFHEEFHHYSLNSEEGVLKKYKGQDLTRRTFGAVLKKIECLHRTAEVECPECSRKLKKVNFIEHLRMHCNDKPFVCRLCTSGFISAVTLRRHLLSHFGCQERTCKHCGKDFKKVGSYEAHMALHEKEMAGDKKNNICETCGAAFYFPYQLRQHAKRHKERQFICTFPGCRWKFVYETELKYHIRSHTNYKPYLCDICGYAGTTKTRLLRHSRTHTGERKFHCEYCEYKAGNYTHLHRHMRIHIGSKPYKCPYCDYSCNTHENIRKHIAKTKKHAGLKIYPCKFCDFATNVGNDFRNHLLDAHEDMVGGRHIEALSEFTGLYKRELDPKEPLEGTRIIPLKDRKPRVSKLLKEQKEKPLPDPSFKSDASTSQISKAVMYFNQDHGNMSLRENVSNNQSHEVVDFCVGNDVHPVQNDSPFMPSSISQPLQLVNMTPVMLKPIDSSGKERVTITPLQSSPAEHISFRTNTGTKLYQTQIQSGIRSLLSSQGGSFRQHLLSFAGEENESKDQMDEDGHNLVIDMAYGNQN